MNFILLIALMISLPQISKAAHLVRDTPLTVAKDVFSVVVEIPAGTNQKWEVNKKSGELSHDIKNGKKRIVQYLAYPFNYGFFPQTLLDKSEGGDGDPLDVAVVGAAVKRGTILQVRPIGVLVVKDRDEIDDKVLAVPVDSEIFKNIKTLNDIDKNFVGITTIMQIFFDHYKGPGQMEIKGWKDEQYARDLIKKAAKGFNSKTNNL